MAVLHLLRVDLAAAFRQMEFRLAICAVDAVQQVRCAAERFVQDGKRLLEMALLFVVAHGFPFCVSDQGGRPAKARAAERRP